MNRREMYERDSGRCAACGFTSPLTEQHRLNRKMGGRGGEMVDELDRACNRITLCGGCNVALETDARYARTGRENGWKLQEHEDPATVAVFYAWAREWRLLDDSGSYEVVEGRDPGDRGLRWDVVAARP